MKPMKLNNNPPFVPFQIIIDTREQRPFFFDRVGDPDFPGLSFEYGTLHTGDYSIKDMDTPACTHSICIERKSLPDLFGSSGRGRERFEREYQRMAEFDYAELVVEADFNAVFKYPPMASMMRPKAVYRTILAFSQRYGVSAWFCPNRQFAERHTYLSLKRFYDDRTLDGKMEFSKI